VSVQRRRIDHRLTPLLAPRSIAVVGASPREWSPLANIRETLGKLAFDGPVYAVNPRYEEIAGEPCYPSLADLPETVDLAVLAVADTRLEENLRAAIDAGARAASIYGTCVLEHDGTPALADRLSAMAREAKLPINGGNCMGYCNYEARINVNHFPTDGREPGAITFLAHSGSVFGTMMGAAERLGLNLAVSCGRELSTSIADYMDYALEVPSTRVVGLFIETVRDPEGFVAALQKAEAKGVPVVALKTGRSEAAARMAVSHSGALTGDDKAYDALFRRYGVLRTGDMDELVATMLLMERAQDLGPGGLATIHDSGGQRELVTDIADEHGVRFAEIGPATVARLSERLDIGLEPENPCDAYGTGKDYDLVSRDCFTALMADDDTALGIFFLDVVQNASYSLKLVEACKAAAAMTTKPVALATNYSGVDHHDLAIRLTREGIPVLDGTRPALKAVANALAWRDWRAEAGLRGSHVPNPKAGVWRARLARGEPLDEAEGLALLADYGIGVPPHRLATSRDEAVAAASDLGFPVVLKTAVAGIAHKTDVGGVKLGLANEADVADAWDDFAGRLGPRALVAPMASDGAELVLGIVADPQFGPMVVVGAGGILVELIGDAATLVAPAPRREVEEVLSGLKASRLLDGVRGGPALDRAAAVDAVVGLSDLAADLGDLIAEMDVNPLRVLPEGVVALDALVVPVARPAQR